MTKKIKADQIVGGVKLGLKNTDIADALGVHRNTVSYHLGKLRDKLRDKSPTEYAEFVRQQVEVMATLVEEVHQGKLPPDAANAIRGLMDSVARLTGSNAPAKRMSLNLNADITLAADPSIPASQLSDDQLYYRIGRAIYYDHRTEEIDLILAYADSLPKIERTPDGQLTDAELLRSIKESEARIHAEHMRPEPESVGPAEIIIDPTVAEGEKLQ
jgi:hypothetical protein